MKAYRVDKSVVKLVEDDSLIAICMSLITAFKMGGIET